MRPCEELVGIGDAQGGGAWRRNNPRGKSAYFDGQHAQKDNDPQIIAVGGWNRTSKSSATAKNHSL